MSYYTQFYPRTVSTEKVKLWNPFETLDIINPDRHCITCVGYAPSQGRRCRNPIQATNRDLITRTLNEVACLPPDSPEVISRLRAIAEPALCIRYHQNQATQVVMDWQRKIKSLKPNVRRPAQATQGSRQYEAARDQERKDLLAQLEEIREALAKMQEERDSARRHSSAYEEREEREERAAKARQDEEFRRWMNEENVREARRKESERLESERLAKQKREKEEKERLTKEKEKAKSEKEEKERQAKAQAEKEEKQRREREDAAANNERIRQRAQKLREQREREKREKEQSERDEWDQRWTKYQKSWVQFRAVASGARTGELRDAIPWPVKSGAYHDAQASNVREFFRKAVPKEEEMAKFMRRECLNWHPDQRRTWLGDVKLGEVEKMVVDMVFLVVSELMRGSAA